MRMKKWSGMDKKKLNFMKCCLDILVYEKLSVCNEYQLTQKNDEFYEEARIFLPEKKHTVQ